MSIRAVVLDIEGTTTAIAFVHEVLFPHARRALPGFVRAHAADPAVAALLADTRREADLPPGAPVDTVIDTLVAWIDADRKATPLKALQGLIWRDGYETGAYQGHLYADVPPCLRAWHAAGIGLYVYSSGSVAAQALLFGHSTHGDLTPLFSGYFDTRTGPKRAAVSYRAILAAVGRTGHEVLFLSDVCAELDAAAAAGMAVTQLLRPGTAPCAAHPGVADFRALGARFTALAVGPAG